MTHNVVIIPLACSWIVFFHYLLWHMATALSLFIFTRVTRLVPHLEQELPTLPEHLGVSPVFSGVRVARSLIFCIMFSRSLFVLLPFLFWTLRCLSFQINGFWLPLWCLQTFIFSWWYMYAVFVCVCGLFFLVFPIRHKSVISTLK